MRFKLHHSWHFFQKSCIHLLLILSIMHVGCSSSRFIPPDSLSDELAEINKNLSGKMARIVLTKSSEKIAAKNVSVTSDSVYYVDRKAKVIKQIALSDVHEIIIAQPGKGAVQGLGVGLVGSAALIGLSYASVAGEFDEIVEDGPGPGIVLLYALAAGAVLLVFTTVTGAAVGSMTYIFDDKEGDKKGASTTDSRNKNGTWR